MPGNERADRFLEAGIRLLAKGLGLGSGDQPAMIFEWLSENKVVAEAQAEGPFSDGKLVTKEALRWQWRHRADYVQALVAHILAMYHWDWHSEVMAESALLLTDESDLIDAIRIVCYSNLKLLIQNPVQRIMPIATVLVSKDQPSQENRATLYGKVSDQWTEVFEATFASHDIRLRPGVNVREAADILAALADGLAMRATGDPHAPVIDHPHPGESLLGKAAMMLLLAAIDPGDHHALEMALRQVLNEDTSDSD